jgi:pyridoxamine 5'-phosphate oxidase
MSDSRPSPTPPGPHYGLLGAKVPERPLDHHDLGEDPISAFRAWLAEAAAFGLPQPEAMVLATATAEGVPSVRWVLLKEVDARGSFVFYTNIESRKAHELEHNAGAALAFYWEPLSRQVRIEGTARRVSAVEADAYWHSRHRQSQLSAFNSRQSKPVLDRATMDRQREEAARFFDDRETPRPDHWGGYRVDPHAIEFWQGRSHRYHDRIRYERRGDGSWWAQRLYP